VKPRKVSTFLHSSMPQSLFFFSAFTPEFTEHPLLHSSMLPCF
jgi:hypothetical protein